MVSHSRLQSYDKHYAMGCLTGSLGCRWHRYQQSTERAKLCDFFWFWFLVVISGFILFWFYYWILSANSLADLNWYAYRNLGFAFPAYTVLFALTCTAFGYICILDVLALCHIGLGQQLYIHWVHRIVLVFTLVFCIIATICLDSLWKDGWQLQKISLMITSPFLHVSAVVVMTFLTWFVAGWILDGNFTCCQSQGLLLVIGLGIGCLLILIPAIAVVVHIRTRRSSSHDPGHSCDAPSATTVTNADAPNTIYAEIIPKASESTRSPSEGTANQIVYAELDLIPKGNKDGKALQELEYANSIQMNSVYANCAQTRV